MEQTDTAVRRFVNPVRDSALRNHLVARRQRLRSLAPERPQATELVHLLQEVDAALERMDQGTFGTCETCHDSIENDRLLANPLCRNCLDHLSPDEQRSLERDLDLAFQIQSGLLPKQGLASPGWTVAYHYEPLGAVSGDYCDVIAQADGTPLVFVGDVTGKGVAASMLMAQLYAIFRSLVAGTRTPAELLANANRVFCEGTLSSYFATVACARIGHGGDVELSNAGHCPPLHVSRQGTTPLGSDGLPLGLFVESHYGAQKLTLSAGDSLVLYSDGLTEAFNAAGEQYGTNRLGALLHTNVNEKPRELLAAVLEDVRQFRAGARRNDDLTLLVIRRETSSQ